MKLLKIIAVLFGAYVLVVIAFESLLGWNQPQGGNTLVITTRDSSGTPKDRVVSRLEGVQLGDNVKVGLEWSKIAANLHGVEIEAMPEKGYALSVIAPSPGGSGRASKVAPAKTPSR